MELTPSIIRIPELSDDLIDGMFRLHGRYFDNLEYDRFRADLDGKDWCIVLQNDVGDPAGFSTVQLIHTHFDGRDAGVVFSGDTVVERRYWGKNILAPAFGSLMLRLMEEQQGTDLFWFLITKGYRTYRFLSVYHKMFYPAYNRSTPAGYAELLHHVARLKFGSAYDPERGVISFNGAKDVLNDEMLKVSAGRERDPHVRFFLQMNPGYVNGDELACIAPVRMDNYNARALRVIRSLSAGVRWIG